MTCRWPSTIVGATSKICSQTFWACPILPSKFQLHTSKHEETHSHTYILTLFYYMACVVIHMIRKLTFKIRYAWVELGWYCLSIFIIESNNSIQICRLNPHFFLRKCVIEASSINFLPTQSKCKCKICAKAFVVCVWLMYCACWITTWNWSEEVCLLSYQIRQINIWCWLYRWLVTVG